MSRVLVSQSNLCDMRHQSTDFLLRFIVSQIIEFYRHPVYAAVTLLNMQEVPSLYPRQGVQHWEHQICHTALELVAVRFLK